MESAKSSAEGTPRTVPLRLTEDALEILHNVVSEAEGLGMPVYVVGGSVRDILLGAPHGDLDLSVEGDALILAERLRQSGKAQVVATHRFGTAELKSLQSVHFDLVTARREWYERPGALPNVEPGSIRSDLARRDFTVNAMAMRPLGDTRAELHDPHGGFADLGSRLIRVLHNASFLDDATRIWRAVKLAKRLDFRIETQTLELALQAIRDGAPSTVSLGRHMRELLLVLREPEAGAILATLGDIGLLGAVHPQLEWRYPPNSPMRPAAGLAPEYRADVYLALMGAEYRADPTEAEIFARSLGLDAGIVRLMRDSAALVSLWEKLGEPHLAPSRIYAMLSPLAPRALRAYSNLSPLADDQPAYARLTGFINTLSKVKPVLGGEYLAGLGIPAGPLYAEILGALRDAKLDGKVPGKGDEEGFIGEWLRVHHTGDVTGGGPVR